jgi:rhamnogalacturonyl hydrolase YesR
LLTHNGWALTGLALAYQNTGDDFALNKVQQQLKTAWKVKKGMVFLFWINSTIIVLLLYVMVHNVNRSTFL